MGSKTLFNAVFIRLEHVVRFFCCVVHGDLQLECFQRKYYLGGYLNTPQWLKAYSSYVQDFMLEMHFKFTAAITQNLMLRMSVLMFMGYQVIFFCALFSRRSCILVSCFYVLWLSDIPASISRSYSTFCFAEATSIEFFSYLKC